MWLFLYFQVCIIFILVAAEVITLTKDNNITCISTEDTLNSPMYIDKFDQPYTLTRITKNIEILNFTDWKSTSDSKNFEPVTDERWTDFKIEQLIRKFNKVSTLSMCTNGTLNQKFATKHYENVSWANQTIKDLNNVSPCQWIHFRITSHRFFSHITVRFHTLLLGHVGMMWNYNATVNFEPEWIISNSVHKIHIYDFWESTTTSSEQSHIDVRQPHKRISMYTSVDKGCFLNVTLSSGNETVTKVVNGTNEENTLKTWKKLEIAMTKTNKNGTLYFFRGRYDNRTTGYWAVDDIQICNNISVVRATLSNNTNVIKNDSICKNLNETNSKENYSNFCDIPSFGKSCNITCGQVLGLPFSNCEKYRIKLGNESHCAWGYRGPNCTETCGPNYWGMDCNKTCAIGCAICNATVGCTKCNSGYVPTNCSQRLPVVTQAPFLVSSTDTTIKISFNLTYNKDEISPDSYIVQYKKGNEEFINYTEPCNYTAFGEVSINITKDTTYRIRIILIYRNFSVQDSIPELTVHKRSLKAELIANDKVLLQWDEIREEKIYNYTVEYECVQNLCSNHDGDDKISTNETKEEILISKSFETCVFNLFVTQKDGSMKQLIDQATVFSPNFTKGIKKEELPKDITLSKQLINVEFETCEQFLSPLNYIFIYKCISPWCSNQTKTVEYNLKQYERCLSITIEDLLPFSSYGIYVVAKRQGQASYTKNYTCTTPPDEPLQVGSMSVYGVNEDKLFVRWNVSYPPRGEVEVYDVTLKNKTTGHTINAANTTAAVCDMWKTFVCADISGLTNLTSFQLTVRAKNYNVSQWGQPASINVTIQNETSAPEELWINLSETAPSNITLEWNHPLFTYGIIQSFQINITDGKTQNTISKNITKYQDKYNETISVQPDTKYNISIWATNNSHIGGAILWVFRSIPDFSNGQFIKFSNQSKKNYLILPKPKKEHMNFNVTLSKNGKVICSDKICEIDGETEENVTYFLNYNNNKILINPLGEETTTQPSTSTSLKKILGVEQGFAFTSTVAAIISTVAIVLSLSYLFYAYKQRKFPFQKRGNEEIVVFSDLQEKEVLLERSNKIDSTSIKIKNLENYIAESLESDPDDNNITQQFQIIPIKASSPCNSGRLPENIHKNRYKNILPYDDTRVILRNNDNGDYINANYIDGYKVPKEFIATQAPLNSTIYDFWEMVCQENVKTIVMLTELEENGRSKCVQYWPTHSSIFRFGKFLIVTLSTEVTPNYIYRKLQVKIQKQTRTVDHYQYITWPDHSVPLCVRSFATFLQEVMEPLQSSPIIVHCNAGCGRTGTFILCDILIKMAKEEGKVDFVEVLKALRQQRPNMLSSVDQYIFAHNVILEYFFGQDFSIAVSGNFNSEIQKALDEASLRILIERLEKATTQMEKTRFKSNAQLTDEEKAKNRFSSILPGNSQVFLPVSSHNYSNYINAVSVDCYRYPEKFIVTQQPLPHTIDDFWKLVREHEIDTIISLNKIDDEDQLCPIFWPENQEIWTLDNDHVLTFKSKDTSSNVYDIVRIRIGNISKNTKIIVNIIDMKCWVRDTLKPPRVNDLISVWKKIMTSSRKVVVTCYDGATASGLFVALAYLLEKINLDHTCDVYTAVKTVRESRSQFVKLPEQVKFLYSAALEYINEFSTYGNFT